MAVTVRAHRKHGSHGGIVMVKRHKRSHPVSPMYMRKRPMYKHAMHKRRSPTHRGSSSYRTSRAMTYTPSSRSSSTGSTGSIAQSLRMYGSNPYLKYGLGAGGVGALALAAHQRKRLAGYGSKLWSYLPMRKTQAQKAVAAGLASSWANKGKRNALKKDYGFSEQDLVNHGM